MRVDVDIQSNYVADAILGALGPESRRECFSVAAAAVKNAVQRHIRGYMGAKHGTATRLNARHTGHYTKGAAAITWEATHAGAVVRIPIPGLSRAWHDVRIRPRHGKLYLTLPAAAVAYGRTVAEIRALGWRVFRPKGKDYLMGSLEDDKKATLLYTLKDGVVQRMDPSLLPTREELSGVAVAACLRHVRKAVTDARRRRRR